MTSEASNRLSAANSKSESAAKRPGRKAPRETARALPIALLRAREAVMLRFRPLVADAGFTDQQWRVLRVLNEQSPLDPTEIAERACILMPSLSRILRNLEDGGQITRATNPHDKRSFEIAITKDAQDIMSELLPTSNAIYEKLERSYGKARMQDLLDMLDDLANLERR